MKAQAMKLVLHDICCHEYPVTFHCKYEYLLLLSSLRLWPFDL